MPAPLLDLTERLAENTHEVWAQRRLAEGWTYSPRRDDAAKLHPCLVPYADLPESEKDYDRRDRVGDPEGHTDAGIPDRPSAMIRRGAGLSAAIRPRVQADAFCVLSLYLYFT